MNKAELVGRMAENSGITRASAEKALTGALEAITGALRGGESVTLVGFGTFSLAQRNAREGRNPATGKSIKIPAKKVVKFKPSSKLAEEMK